MLLSCTGRREDGRGAGVKAKRPRAASRAAEQHLYPPSRAGAEVPHQFLGRAVWLFKRWEWDAARNRSRGLSSSLAGVETPPPARPRQCRRPWDAAELKGREGDVALLPAPHRLGPEGWVAMPSAVAQPAFGDGGAPGRGDGAARRDAPTGAMQAPQPPVAPQGPIQPCSL